MAQAVREVSGERDGRIAHRLLAEEANQIRCPHNVVERLADATRECRPQRDSFGLTCGDHSTIGGFRVARCSRATLGVAPRTGTRSVRHDQDRSEKPTRLGRARLARVSSAARSASKRAARSLGAIDACPSSANRSLGSVVPSKRSLSRVSANCAGFGSTRCTCATSAVLASSATVQAAGGHHRHSHASAYGSDDFAVEERVLTNLRECNGQGRSPCSIH